MIEFLKTKLKLLLCIIAICAMSFGAGWLTRSPEERVVEKIKTVEVEKKTKKSTTKTTKKPDGTVITTVTEAASDTTTKSKTEVIPESNPYTPDFSVAFGGSVSASDLKPTYRAGVGYRVLGNLWTEIDVNAKGSVGAGLRINF